MKDLDAIARRAIELSQRQLDEIRLHGQLVRVWQTGQSIKCLIASDKFHFLREAPVTVGTLFATGDEFGYRIVTAIDPDGARLVAHTELLPCEATVHNLYTSVLGGGHNVYRKTAVTPDRIPCSRINSGKLLLPDGIIKPLAGQIVYVGGVGIDPQEIEIKRVTSRAPYVVCDVAPWRTR